MSNVLENLKPASVFKYFEEISNIPRGSGNEKEISNYLVAFAKKHGLEVIQDEALNVIIRKNGTAGYENAPTVIIQGHMDMVCEKNSDTIHDFEKDPIKLRIEGDMIYGTNTTLGADDGIAVAYGLALLASDDIPHPPLEILITTSEETGMDGAIAIDPKNIKGRLLINIDSEEEGFLLVSCAGGMRARQILPITWEAPNKDHIAYHISLRGLRGGHSGAEIEKGRGNSNKLMGRFLNDLLGTIPYTMSKLSGGSKNNAIPREADVFILMDQAHISLLEEKINEWNEIFKNELRTADPEVHINCKKTENNFEQVFSKETTKKAVSSLVLIPNGVQSMSMEIEGLVESSTNLGVVTTTDKSVTFESAIRSSVKSLKDNIENQSKLVADALGCEFIGDASYPEWAYNPDSKLRPIFVDVYEKLYAKKPEVTAIHAGLECGLFKEKINDLDMISVGPNMFDVHTPDEHLSISSTERTWDYLLSVLKEIK